MDQTLAKTTVAIVHREQPEVHLEQLNLILEMSDPQIQHRNTETNTTINNNINSLPEEEPSPGIGDRESYHVAKSIDHFLNPVAKLHLSYIKGYI